jgi:polyphosphate kinase
MIRLKMNSLTNYSMVESLYNASRSGVKIQLIIRGVCCLIPGVKGMSENIEVISVVDKFLEHTRLMIFENDGNPHVFISSADWMTRNIENRVEVSCPIYDAEIKSDLIANFSMTWNDNAKARILNGTTPNMYKSSSDKRQRSQIEIYNHYKNKLSLED